jgi:hypothetical protein
MVIDLNPCEDQKLFDVYACVHTTPVRPRRKPACNSCRAGGKGALACSQSMGGRKSALLLALSFLPGLARDLFRESLQA